MKLQFPKVSVVVTTYNRPEMLREALEAILNQTFRDFEVVVVDDGSHTAKPVLESMREDFKNGDIVLRGIDLPENSGFQSVPNNVAFQYCTGTYIAQADDDDIWDDIHLETLVEAIEDKKTDVVYSRFRNSNTNEAKGGPKNGSEFPYIPFNYLTMHLILNSPFTNFIKTDALWSKAAVFLALGSKPWNEEVRKFGDWDFFRRCIEHGLTFHGVNKVTLTYRWGHEQIQTDRAWQGSTPRVIHADNPAWTNAEKELVG